jgi:hypothetical protein
MATQAFFGSGPSDVPTRHIPVRCHLLCALHSGESSTGEVEFTTPALLALSGESHDGELDVAASPPMSAVSTILASVDDNLGLR